jgi:ketosteroid isomerase-like protein
MPEIPLIGKLRGLAASYSDGTLDREGRSEMPGSAQGAAILPFGARPIPSSGQKADRAQLLAVRRGIDAYNRRDLEALRPLHHPDVELDWSASRSPTAGIYQGIDAVMQFHAEYIATFERIVIEPERLILSGSSVLVPNVARVRGRDGIEVAARSTLVFTFRGRRLIHIRLCQTADGEPISA